MDYEKIYLDFVSWGLYSPTFDSLIEFSMQPSWLVTKLWIYYHEQKYNTINLESVATAKMALLLEMGFNSFGGGKSKVIPDIKRFLPFSTPSDTSLSQDTIDIFWELNDNNLIPGYFQSALIKETELFEEIKNKKPSKK